MQKILAILTVALTITFAAGAKDMEHAADAKHAEAHAVEGKAQTHCPIRGGKINKDVYTDVEGKRVYFCCPGCDKAFLKDAAANIKKMEAEGIVLAAAPVQSLCPVSGEPIDKDIMVEHEGRKVYLCCNGCRDDFKKDPEAYMKKVDKQLAHAEKAKAHADKGHKDKGHEEHNH